jgi:hypothetical protein
MDFSAYDVFFTKPSPTYFGRYCDQFQGDIVVTRMFVI